MATISLHSIFRHLTADDNFLSTVIEVDYDKRKKKGKKAGCNLMANMVPEYLPLAPYETQNWSVFPPTVKDFLTKDHTRLGIKSIMERNLTPVNVSFLASFNILIRPDIYKQSIDDHFKNLTLLENFVTNSIRRNFQIDKTKNTRKVKLTNQMLIKELTMGKISPPVIQYLVNIFEINLVIFDLVKVETHFYWAFGHKYPYFNPFNELHFMSLIQGNYEPIIPIDTPMTNEQKFKIYIRILSNLTEIKTYANPIIGTHTLLYFNTFDIDPLTFSKLIKLHQIEKPSIIDNYKKLFQLEKN